MTIYKVHIYREMRLEFAGIDAESPEAAAAIARERASQDAGAVEDCDGETLAALVDVDGDAEHLLSRMIDFEGARIRRAARNLLAALEGVVPYAEGEGAALYECWRQGGGEAAREASDACEAAIEHALAVIAEMRGASISAADNSVPSRGDPGTRSGCACASHQDAVRLDPGTDQQQESVMTKSPPYSEHIAADLTVILNVLSEAARIIETGREAAERGQPDTAIGSIVPAEPLLNDAATLLKASLILHARTRADEPA